MFAYCANNPVMFKDDSGEFVVSISIGIGSLLTWIAYGIATAVGVGAGVAIGTAVGNNIRRSTTCVDTRSDSKAKEKDRRIKKTAPIYIYRYNGTMSDWIKAGTNSIWTKTLKRIVKRYPR